MLNEQNVRELAYKVIIDDVYAHPNADRLDIAIVGGWHVICGKGELNKGDEAVYFEIDSQLPDKKPFSDMEFLATKHFKIKTQKIRGEYSQGLLVPISAFDETEFAKKIVSADKWLTEALEVTYAIVEDNKRKANSDDKYKRMAQRRPNIFKKPFVRWLMKYAWGRKLMFAFFGKKKDKVSEWPAEIAKTDEERAQNQVWRFREGNSEKWIVTEKIDGTSTTAFLKRKSFGRHEYKICSRNVVFNKPDKTCFYDTNVYIEMSEKYNFEKVLLDLADKFNLEWIALQGETYGGNIQKRDYSMSEHDFKGFNLIFSDRGRLNSYEARDILAEYGIPWVPIICDDYVLPATVDEILAYAEGNSVVDGLPREGYVFRSQDGKDSFKAVSNSFLLKYHQ